MSRRPAATVRMLGRHLHRAAQRSVLGLSTATDWHFLSGRWRMRRQWKLHSSAGRALSAGRQRHRRHHHAAMECDDVRHKVPRQQHHHQQQHLWHHGHNFCVDRSGGRGGTPSLLHGQCPELFLRVSAEQRGLRDRAHDHARLGADRDQQLRRPVRHAELRLHQRPLCEQQSCRASLQPRGRLVQRHLGAVVHRVHM